jgi:FtsP/CotA-like multicopper oxidase with cupredoxin domain
MRNLTAFLGILLLVSAGRPSSRIDAPRAAANDNRLPAGTMQRDTLVLALVVQRAEWYPEAQAGPHITIEAFGEEGKAPSIPAPLIRVVTGTPVHVRVRNALGDSTIHVIGLGRHPIAADDTLRIPPGDSATRTFTAGAAGTFVYRAVIGNNPDGRPSERETAGGAFVVDPVGGSPPDRIFVINLIADGPDQHIRNALGINGRSWPHTERLSMTVGDTSRWRLVNATTRGHPLHLHGFYFRVDAEGNGISNRELPLEAQRLGVTELVAPWHTRTITWAPNRPGNWLFHCHLMAHVTSMSKLDPDEAGAHDARHSPDPDKHMAGLVLGISVRPRPAESYDRMGEPRRLHLYFQQGGPRGRMPTTYSYVLQRGSVPPQSDSVEIPGRPIVLFRDQATDIVVHNRAKEATVVHWHGLELESWSDGVAGWSSRGTERAPSIAPGDSFTARLTLPRAGTFIYHTHLNDIPQVSGGAAGALLVLEPGEVFHPDRDHVFLAHSHGPPATPHEAAAILVNGDSAASPPKELAARVVHRIRLINIGAGPPVRFTLLRDTTVATWRRVADDGADLPPALRVRVPAMQILGVGETYDFEFAPEGPGTYRMVAVRALPPVMGGSGPPWVQLLIVR